MNRLAGLKEVGGMLIVYLILVVVLKQTVPNFGTWVNIRNLLLSVTTVGLISCTMLFCMAAGDFDLSVGSTVSLAAVLSAIVLRDQHSVMLAVLIPLLAGAAVGAANGFVIAKIGINALIATLASMQIVRGIALIVTTGTSVGISDPAFSRFGSGDLGGMPYPVLLLIVMMLFFGFVLARTVFGRNTLAVGGSLEAARLAGINPARIKIVIFTLQGVMAALAGVVLASRVTMGEPRANQGLELQVISACVLGGVSLTGGIGSMVGVAVGVLIMGTVQNAMTLRGVEQFWQYIVSGTILLAAVMFDQARQRAIRRKESRV